MTVKITTQDFGKVGHALGVVDGIAKEFESGLYTRDLVRAAGRYASNEMGEQMDKMALGDPSLAHVYEWRQPGIRAARLFDIYSKGNGKTELVTFRFMASKTPVPSLQEREDAGEILPVPEKIKSRMKNRSYVFRQKAQFFEYGVQAANIRPLGPNKKIFIPFSEVRNGRTYAFVDSSTVTFAQTKYRGRFTLAWNTLAIQTGGKASSWIDHEVSSETRDISMRMGKTSSKTVYLGFSSGQDYARNRMKLSGKNILAKSENEVRA